MKIKVLLLVCCLLVAGVTTGMCEADGPVFFVSPMIGGHIFDGNQDIDDRPTYAFGIGAEWERRYGLEAMFNWTHTESRPTADHINVWGARLDGYYNFFTDQNFIPYAAIGIGGNHFNQSNNDKDHLIVDYGVGAKYFLNKSIALRCDVRDIVGFNDSYNNFLYTAGFSWFFPADKPVRAAEKKPVEQKPVIRDQDGDGVPDALDQCKDTPMGIGVDAQGCPLDADKDGVFDYLDNCPDTMVNVMVDTHGCPMDSDKDGVYDYLDNCPGTLAGTPVDEKGCWEINPLYFQDDKTDIISKYYMELDMLAGIMTRNPGINLEIQGHTDNRGAVQYNENLSQKRADTVKAYLVSKGIDAKRINTKGYAASQAIAPNDTPEGRALNRRVVIKIK